MITLLLCTVIVQSEEKSSFAMGYFVSLWCLYEELREFVCIKKSNTDLLEEIKERAIAW